MISCILAAGTAERFGSCKALYKVNDKPMIEHVIDAIPEAQDIYVVTGSYREELEDYLKSKDVSPIHNPDYQKGMGTSIRVAATQALKLKSDLLLTFCDLPFVTKEDYNILISKFSIKPVFSQFEGIVGPPAIFPATQLEVLLTLEADHGAKKLFKEYN